MENKLISEDVIEILQFRIQLEELSNTNSMIDLLNTFGEEKHTMLLLDTEIENYLA